MRLLRFRSLVKAACAILGLFAVASSAREARRLTLAEREYLARPLLVHAESISSAVDPDTRAILLYRAAGAWLPLDQSRAVRLYRQAFAAAHLSSGLREQLEEAILNDLLPVSASEVSDLLPDAGGPTQKRLYSALINFELFKGHYPAAAQCFSHAISSGIFPRGAAVHLLASLPRDGPIDRAQIFAAITRYFQAHPDPDGFHWSLADLIVRFYVDLPPARVQEAVEVVLKNAEQYEEQHHGGATTFGGEAGAISFHSSYDFQLFAVAPILERMHPDLAARLLLGHDEAANYLRRYPEGLRSWDKNGFFPGRDVLRSGGKIPGPVLFNSAAVAQSLSSLDMGLEFTVPRNLDILGVTGSQVFMPNAKDPEAVVIARLGNCPSDFAHRLDLVRSVPMTRKELAMCGGGGCSYRDTFPRAGLVQVIAERCTYHNDPAAARAALKEQVEILKQLPAADRIGYLATAADLYLRLGDMEAAAGVVQMGFSAARALYELELGSPYSKSVWASAEAYRRMVTLGVNASLEATRKAIEEIPDPDLRELEKVMEARALLGVPVRRYVVVSEAGGICTGEVEVTYDQF